MRHIEACVVLAAAQEGLVVRAAMCLVAPLGGARWWSIERRPRGCMMSGKGTGVESASLAAVGVE